MAFGEICGVGQHLQFRPVYAARAGDENPVLASEGDKAGGRGFAVQILAGGDIANLAACFIDHPQTDARRQFVRFGLDLRVRH